MRWSASGFAAAAALLAILGAFGGVLNDAPAPEGAGGPLAAGLLGIPTERVEARDAAAQELLAAELDAHIAVLEYGAQVRIRRLASVMEELTADGFRCVPARVEDVDLAGDTRRLVVSAGYAQGIPENAVAISFFKSLAGLVIDVHSERSEVLLVTDPASAVPAMVREPVPVPRTDEDDDAGDAATVPPGVRGAVLGGQGSIGTAPELLRFTYIEGTGNVLPDQVLVTSGDGDLYPQGLPIGRVIGNPVTMESLAPPYADVRPIAYTGALREVILAWRVPGGEDGD